MTNNPDYVLDPDGETMMMDADDLMAMARALVHHLANPPEGCSIDETDTQGQQAFYDNLKPNLDYMGLPYDLPTLKGMFTTFVIVSSAASGFEAKMRAQNGFNVDDIFIHFGACNAHKEAVRWMGTAIARHIVELADAEVEQ